VLDPIVLAAGIGVVASPVVGRALLQGLRSVPQRWQRTTLWLLTGSIAALAVLAELRWEGPVKQGVFVVLLGTLPGLVIFVVWRTALGSAVVSLVPLYFGIGAQTLGRPLHRPEVALDRAISLQPAWMLVYGSLLVFVLLPLLLVRENDLFRRAMRAYLLVLIVAYLGFASYPTVGPRPPAVPGEGFWAWCLRLQYSLDWPYNCFPSLHVAHSFVSALTSYRVHRGVGLAAVLWAALIGVSTLYTKQHYLVDVIAGAVMGGVAYALFLRRHPREAIAARDHQRAPLRALGVVGMFGAMVAFLWVMYATRTIVR
jgi:membrane-associated phospholipid phosphatase